MVALLLSACFPGLGYLYLDRIAAFLAVAVAEFAVLLAFRGLCPFLVLHLLATAGAVGAARVRTDYGTELLVPPRPVEPGSLVRDPEPGPEPAGPPAWVAAEEDLIDAPAAMSAGAPAFDAHAFTEELRAASEEFVKGQILRERFEARKSAVLGALPRLGEAERARLAAACAGLAAEGILSSDEVRLAERYARGR